MARNKEVVASTEDTLLFRLQVANLDMEDLGSVFMINSLVNLTRKGYASYVGNGKYAITPEGDTYTTKLAQKLKAAK